jgi:hypothetical protein
VARRNVQTLDLGANHQMTLEVRPAHDPVREHGFVGVVMLKLPSSRHQVQIEPSSEL